MPNEQTTITENIPTGSVRTVRLENALLRVDVSPETGGRITSLFNKPLQREFLWRNERLPLRRVPPGEPYDPNFFGGIDEVIPGDLPERIGALGCPDHGELWTLALPYRVEEDALVVEGQLPVWGLRYQKRVSLRPFTAWIDLDYHIENPTGERRIFLWKLHAAAAISSGDRLDCPAQKAVVADLQWSRWQVEGPFDWPQVNGEDADRIPPADGSTDFLFLYKLAAGQVALRSPSAGCALSIDFDRRVFPYVCYFASYGGLDGHYTAVLEPCTAMPVSVNEAARQGQCSVLESGETLETRVSIYAGPDEGYQRCGL